MRLLFLSLCSVVLVLAGCAAPAAPAAPSGNGAAALLGLWLGRYYSRSDWEAYAEEVAAQVADHLLRA